MQRLVKARCLEAAKRGGPQTAPLELLVLD